MANKGLIIGGVAVVALGGLALLAGSAEAKEEELPPPPGPTPPPKSPGGKTDTRSVEDMAFQVRNHQLYWTWVAAHRACLNADVEGDPEGASASCAAAQNLWSTMMSDLNIPANKTDDVFNQLGEATL